MCGFVGFSSANAELDKVKIINDMMKAILHRGPDSGDFFSDNEITMGFRRLKIIDLSDEASQPMFNEDRSCVLVFKGEIYNYQELREELITKGHIFKNNSDSEVIIHGYEEYGENILKKLRGMFAFAIWDKVKETLFMARDMFGIKPLYYTQNTLDGSFLFGSEIKSFLKHPNFIKELNNDALKPYLTFQYSVMDETFFKGVYKLKPAHYIIYRKGEITLKPYWFLKFDIEKESLEHYVEEIKKTLKESVDYHKVSDVKIGSFLSGGIDSSYITSLLKPDKTFSIGFQDYEGVFNETNLAKELSDLLKIENHRKNMNADEFFDIIPTIQYHMDEPHSNLSSIPLYYLSKLAREHVTVVLSGEGADEIFGGYEWYIKSNKLELYEKIPYKFRELISSAALKLPKNRISNFLIKGGQTIEEKFVGQAKIYEEKDALDILKGEYTKGPSVETITKEVYKNVENKDDLTKMQYLDLKLWLPGDILLKADKMSMANSIELRVPFLDKEVMSLGSKLPSSLRVNKSNTKFALRKASEEILPKEWSNRPKAGFPVPIKYWLREKKYYDMIKEVFNSDFAEEFFKTEKLINMLDIHYNGDENYARKIWTVYVFLIWYRKFFIELK